CTSGVDYW
nr:immunoglobulin heavy chain junction region [Macaca mulatta]